jgi:membrane glycosyltransferase
MMIALLKSTMSTGVKSKRNANLFVIPNELIPTKVIANINKNRAHYVCDVCKDDVKEKRDNDGESEFRSAQEQK